MVKIISILTVLLIASCAFQLNGNQEAQILFSLGLNSRSLQSRNLPTLSSIEVIVEATDMERLVKSFSPDQDPITVKVPAGLARSITVRLITEPNADTNVRSFGARTTVDLYPQQTTNLSLFVQPLETDYVVADPGAFHLNNTGTAKILVMNQEPNTLGQWTEVLSSSFTPTPITNYRPVALDWDKDGLIYFATDAGNNTNGRIFRAKKLSSSGITYQQFINVTGRIVAIAIDRKNDILYYINPFHTTPSVFRLNITNLANNPSVLVSSGSDITLPSYPVIDYVNSYDSPTLGRYAVGRAALAVDHQGMVYLAGEPDGDMLIKLNPNLPVNQRILAQRSINSLELPSGAHPWTIMDIRVEDKLVFVLAYTTRPTRAEGQTWGSLLVFHADTLNLISRRLYNPSGTSPRNSDRDKLASPRRFGAVLGRRLLIIDEGGLTGDVFSPIFFDQFNRLVFVNPVNGNFVSAIPEDGNTSAFSFFSNFYNC